MTNAVGDREERYCGTCNEETMQFIYHSGEWDCETCGEEQ